MHVILLLIVDPFTACFEWLASRRVLLQEPVAAIHPPQDSSRSMQERMAEDENTWVSATSKLLARNTKWIENQLDFMTPKSRKPKDKATQMPEMREQARLGPFSDNEDDLPVGPQKSNTGRSSSLVDWLCPRRHADSFHKSDAKSSDSITWFGFGASQPSGLDDLKYPPGFAEQQTAIGRMLEVIGWNPSAWDVRARYLDRQVELEQQSMRPSDLAGELLRESRDGPTDEFPSSTSGNTDAPAEETANSESEETNSMTIISLVESVLPSKAQASLALMTFLLLSVGLLWILTGLALSSACKDPRFPFSSMSMYSTDPSLVVRSACLHPYA